MNPSQFFTATRLVIVAGKGGVGKTAVSAALGWGAAHCGLNVLLIEVEADGSLARCFAKDPSTYDGQVVYEPDCLAPHAGELVVPGRITARNITGDRALRDYLDGHGLKQLAARLLSRGMLDVVATTAPGIEDLLVLGKIKQIERSGIYDLIIVDAPAAGHALGFLVSAAGLVDAVDSGPIRTQAAEVTEMLRDQRRCQVMLVTLAEETPVNETVETAFALEDRVGVSLGPIVVNACVRSEDSPPSEHDAAWLEARSEDIGPAVPPGMLAAAAQARDFDHDRAGLQTRQRTRLAERLPLPQLGLPLVHSAGIGLDEIAILAEALLAEIETMG